LVLVWLYALFCCHYYTHTHTHFYDLHVCAVLPFADTHGYRTFFHAFDHHAHTHTHYGHTHTFTVVGHIPHTFTTHVLHSFTHWLLPATARARAHTVTCTVGLLPSHTPHAHATTYTPHHRLILPHYTGLHLPACLHHTTGSHAFPGLVCILHTRTLPTHRASPPPLCTWLLHTLLPAYRALPHAPFTTFYTHTYITTPRCTRLVRFTRFGQVAHLPTHRRTLHYTHCGYSYTHTLTHKHTHLPGTTHVGLRSLH